MWTVKRLPRREMETNQLLVTSAMREAVIRGLEQLAITCDGARQIDGSGFNKMDSAIGKQLAWAGSPQAACPRRQFRRA